MQQKSNSFYGITAGVILVLLGFIWFYKTSVEPSGSEVKQNAQVRTIASITKSIKTSPVLESPVQARSESLSEANQQRIKDTRSAAYKCMSQQEWEISKNCGDTCLSNYLKTVNLPELAEYIAEGFITDHVEDVGKIENPQSRYGRFQKAMYLAGKLYEDTPEHRQQKPIDMRNGTRKIRRSILQFRTI